MTPRAAPHRRLFIAAGGVSLLAASRPLAATSRQAADALATIEADIGGSAVPPG